MKINISTIRIYIVCVYMYIDNTVPCLYSRHLSEVMLQEISHIPGPELEFAQDRESYALAAGMALGMITLGVSPYSLNDCRHGGPSYYNLT